VSDDSRPAIVLGQAMSSASCDIVTADDADQALIAEVAKLPWLIETAPS